MHSPSSNTKPVVIVGGGLSGLAAAVELSSQAIPVILLEQKPKLGGRAYSFPDATTGEIIDNGQHVLIAGYAHTMKFLERIGTKQLLTIHDQPTFHLHHPQRGMCQFNLPQLPNPLHLVMGILSTDLFALADKLRLLRAGLSIQMSRQNSSLDAMTIEQWLQRAGQSEETRRSFWEPLAVSIMNEHIAKASAKVFVQSLRQAFLGGRNNASLAISQVGLSELFVNDAVKYVVERGGEVRCNADAVALETSDDKVVGVKLRGGSIVNCSATILAVPNYRLSELIVPSIQFSVSPILLSAPSTSIVSIHLWFENDFMAHDVVGLIDRRVQWIFNKRRIERETREGGHVSCVISGAEKFVAMTNDELVRIAMEDVRSVYNSAPQTSIHDVVIREKRATFSCTPEVERLRPDHQTPISNLFLAGDWTNTGLPATIEGAIISGEHCARFILS